MAGSRFAGMQMDFEIHDTAENWDEREENRKNFYQQCLAIKFAMPTAVIA
jgi:hypothetical protein